MSSPSGPAPMAAIIGLSIDVVGNLCAQAADDSSLVSIANLNTPSQIVVSGEVAGVLRLIELASAAGAARAQRLGVGAGFHTALMEPVQSRLSAVMGSLTWHDTRVRVASNASGGLVSQASDVRSALVAQITSPVQWVACVKTLIKAGATTFLEIGSGRILLGGFMHQITPHGGHNSGCDPGAKELCRHGSRRLDGG